MSDSGKIIRAARKLRLAVPAFNVPYLPMVEPVVRAIRDEDAFSFIEVARLEFFKFEARSLRAVKEEYDRHADPARVRLHLDHVPVLDEDGVTVDYLPVIQEAIQLGYDSVMVDGSRLTLDDNIAATRRVVEAATKGGVPCEAELGSVLGHEAGPPLPYDEIFKSGRGFTDVAQATRFAKETGCHWLSVAVGNIHGAISKALKDTAKPQARLDLAHLEKLVKATALPLVLHGGSGIQVDALRKAIAIGIAKVNVGTEIRQAYEQALKATGKVASAQDATYASTRALLNGTFQLTGTGKRLLDAARFS